MTKRMLPTRQPDDPLVPIEYLLDLMGWKSRSTYYNRLRDGEKGFPHPVKTGSRNVMLLASECHAYQQAVIERSKASPESDNGEGGAPAVSGQSSPAGASA